MPIQLNKTFSLAVLLLMSAFFLSACDNNNNNGDDSDTPPEPAPEPVTVEFEVSVVNATSTQPFSPIAVIAHTDQYSLFEIGEPSTTELEVLAEGGNNADLIAAAETADGVLATVSAEGPTGPGATENLSLTVNEDDLPGLTVSVVSMLVNSNDAITAVRGMSLEGMEVGDIQTVVSISYDTGTEANSEAIGTIPGPADGGEGFNADRDDIANIVTGHPGVLTVDNGLSSSILTEVHRWDHPVAYISVMRVQ